MKKFLFLAAVVSLSACKKEKDKVETPPVVEEASHFVCQYLTTFGENQQEGAELVPGTQTLACWQGSVTENETTTYPADTICQGPGIFDPESTFFNPVESTDCPTADVIARCDLATSTIFVYAHDQVAFEKEVFEAYCADKGTFTEVRPEVEEVEEEEAEVEEPAEG